jgi:methionine synthase I (cobalamin-dependent)
LPVIGSMTFDSGPEQVETALGTTVPQACAEMAEAGAAVVGCDCGDSPDSAPAVVSLIRQSCDLPIWVKVDAGQPELVEGRVVYPETPQEFAGRLKPLAQQGANFVGGCCGASAGHIAALAAIRNKPRRKQR